MLRIQYATSRAIAWAVSLWATLHVIYSKDLIRTFRTGYSDLSVDLLYFYLIVSSLMLTYQMLLNQRLIQDVKSAMYSLTCDIFTVCLFLGFSLLNQYIKQRKSLVFWDTSVVIALSLLVGYKWKSRSMEIRADRTISRFLKSFSVHIVDKCIKMVIVLFTLFVSKEVLSVVYATLWLRKPILWTLKLQQGLHIMLQGLWYTLLLEYAMVTLEYFLFHPINFTQSPWVQIIPKMGLRAIKGSSDISILQNNNNNNANNNAAVSSAVRYGEKSLMDYLHGLSSHSSPEFIARDTTETDKALLRSVADTYQQCLRQLTRQSTSTDSTSSNNNKYANDGANQDIVVDLQPAQLIGIQQFVFSSQLSSVITTYNAPNNVHATSGSWLTALLAPVYGYLECQAFFDLHRITRSSKLRREPLFREHFHEWLSATITFFLRLTLQMKEVLHFVKNAYEIEDFLQDMERFSHAHNLQNGTSSQDASLLSSSSASASSVTGALLAAVSTRSHPHGHAAIGVDTMVQTQGQGIRSVNNAFTFPRSPERRQRWLQQLYQEQDVLVPAANSSSSSDNVLLSSPSSSSSRQHKLQKERFQSWLFSYFLHDASSLQSPSSWMKQSAWMQFLDSVFVQGETSLQMGTYLCLGACYQTLGYLWQLPLRGEVSDNRKQQGDITTSLRRYFSRWFSTLFAQEIVNALDSTSTLLFLALAEDRTASGRKSTGALLGVVYVLLLFEDAVEEVIDLLHQTHTTKVSMANKAAMSAASSHSDLLNYNNYNHNNSSSNSNSTFSSSPLSSSSKKSFSSSSSTAATAAVSSYRRFKLKSLQLLPREIIALRRGVKEALAKIWRAYVDILIVQDLPGEVQRRAMEYRRVAMMSQST